MRERWTMALVAGLVAAACGGDGGGPMGNQGPDVRGTYEGTYTIEATTDGNPLITGMCPGRIVVTQSSGGNFSGSVRIDPCGILGNIQTLVTPFSGTVQEDGSVRFTVALLVEALLAALQQEGCVADIEEAFTGSITGTTFAAGIGADVMCPDQDEIHVEVSFEGDR